MSHTTKEGIEVRVGQVWIDLDKRMGGRHVRVMDLAFNGETAVAFVARCRQDGMFVSSAYTRLSVKRMHKSATGWRLAKDI